MALAPRPIVVLGMQRSGTSAVAGALSALGAFMGEQADFFPPDANNSAGYFEQQSLSTLNHKCLAFFQMSSVSVRPLPEFWFVFPQARILTEELARLLTQTFSNQQIWGFKQPMSSIIMPLYHQVFTDLGLSPQFVVCVRNPLEIQASEAHWEYGIKSRQMAPLGNRAVGVWLNYTLSALEGAKGADTTVVPYSEFVSDPVPFLSDIVSKQPGWNPSGEQWTAAQAAIQPHLKRQDRATGELEIYPQLVKATWDYCNTKIHTSDQLAFLLKEYKLWRDILEPPKLSGTRLGFAWNQGGSVQSSQQPFMPAGTWQTVSLPISAPPMTELHGLMYSKPCRVWIKKCVFIHSSKESAAKLVPGPGSNLVEINGMLRLEGAYEARQISLMTPRESGPYQLGLEFLLESGERIVTDAASRVSQRLHQCSTRKASLEKQ